MNAKPLVSIAMPVYNAMPFLRGAVQSIFAQTLDDWELLAVDDGSSDGSWEYLQRIDDPRVRPVHLKRNYGATAAINRAIDMARGRWIARMDADDYILPERLEKQAAALTVDPRIDVLGTGSFVVDKELNLVSVRWAPTSHEVIARWPSMYYQLTFGALMGKTEWWKRWRMDERIGIAGYEFDLYFRSHRDSVFSNVPEPLYVYRFIGHTQSWWKMTRSVYYKAMTLGRNGFRRGVTFATVLGLASLAPRPLLYAVKLAVGSRSGLVRAGQREVTAEDEQRMRRGLEKVSQATVPLRSRRPAEWVRKQR